MENKKRSIGRIILEEGEKYLAAVFCIAIVLLLFIQVVSRFVFHHSFTWTEELAVVLFVWMTYTCIASAVTKNKHIRVDFLLKMFPYNAQRIIFIIDNVICIVYCALMGWGVIGITLRYIERGGATMLLGIPKWLCYGIIPIGLALTIIRFIENSVTLIKAKGEPLNVAKPIIDVDALEQEYLASIEKNGKE